jgi:hypothetical protein
VPDDLAARAQAWLTDAVEHTRQLAPDDAGRVLPEMTLATFHAQRATASDYVIAERLLTECMSALAGTPATRLHHTVVGNLGRLHLARGDWAAAARVFETACLHADAVIRRARTPATRLAHVAAAGDLYQRLALCHAQQEDARLAIQAVERSRARWGSAADWAFADPRLRTRCEFAAAATTIHSALELASGRLSRLVGCCRGVSGCCPTSTDGAQL